MFTQRSLAPSSQSNAGLIEGTPLGFGGNGSELPEQAVRLVIAPRVGLGRGGTRPYRDRLARARRILSLP